MRERLIISAQRRHWRKAIALTVIALSIISAGAGGTPSCASQKIGRFPDALKNLKADYPPDISAVLKALKQGVDQYEKGLYAPALEALPSDRDAKLVAIGDYILLYRARSYLMLKRSEEALKTFRLLDAQYPDTPLSMDSLFGKCQALLELQDPASVLSALRIPRLTESADKLYYEARALHESGEKEKAIELYLRIYSDYVSTKNASLAESYLRSLSSVALTGTHNYNVRLQRAENLLKSGNARDARALLIRMGRAAAPNSLTFEKRNLLMGEVEYSLGSASRALPYLQEITEADPLFHARAIYLQAACFRKLDRKKSFLSMRDKALQLYPKSPSTENLLYSVATYFDVNNEPKNARDAYRAIYDAFPKGKYAERALWKAALFSYLEKQYDEAAHGFWKHLTEFPNPSSAGAALYWMGRCYGKLGDSEHARYLYAQARRLANEGYYGQRSLEALKELKTSRESGGIVFSGIDFKRVILACDEIQLGSVTLAQPDSTAARIIERVRQLVAAGLPDPGISELSWAIRRHPQNAALFRYAMSRVYEVKQDYYSAISSLRRAFPDYNILPNASIPDEIWQLLFPVRHWEIVSKHAAATSVDPRLILGMIRQESAFDEKARSSANARGLMQILPSTGRKLARQARIRRYSVGKLYEAETNIALGARHFASLFRQYGREELALAAYNAGETRVDRWLKEFSPVDMAEFVELIPFGETRGYVKQVLSNKAHYSFVVSPAAAQAR